MHAANMCIKEYFFFKFFNSYKIQLVKLECCQCSIFFQRPHQLWEAPTFAFLIGQFGIYKTLLVVTLMPYKKSWNIKAIKCKVVIPQPFELLNIQLPTYLPPFFPIFWAFSINEDELAFYIMLASKNSCRIESRQEMKNGISGYMSSW